MSATGTPLKVYGPGGGAADDAAIMLQNSGYISWISAGTGASDTRYDAAHHQFQNFGTPEGFITGLQSIAMAKTSGDNTITSASGGNLVLNALGASGNVYIKHNGSTVVEHDSTNSPLWNNLIPRYDSFYTIGENGLRWSYGYFDNVTGADFILDNTVSGEPNDIDGTRGHWVIQEGEDNLYIKNELTGKKYKFKLEEI